ncbi:MAG: RNA polymerase sigma factor [Pirellulaceae bacterium]
MNLADSQHNDDDDASERRIIQAVLAGDQNQYRVIVQRHQQAIATQMRRFSRDPLLIEELVQEVFVEAFLSLHTFRQRSPLLHWLRRIAVRIGYRFWTKQSRQKNDNVDLSSVEEYLATNEPSADWAEEKLGNVLAHLKPRDRLVLTLLYWDECSIAEAADLTGWSQTLVKVQAHRARQRLKKMLESKEHGSHRKNTN